MDPSLPNLKLAKDFVEKQIHLGYLVFDNDNFIGWTASGPKTEFPLLRTKLASRLTDFKSNIWSIGCLSMKNCKEEEGAFLQVIDLVIQQARLSGVEYLEAYPVDPWDKHRSYRGNKDWYRQLGFKQFGSEEDGVSKIICMRLKL